MQPARQQARRMLKVDFGAIFFTQAAFPDEAPGSNHNRPEDLAKVRLFLVLRAVTCVCVFVGGFRHTRI